MKMKLGKCVWNTDHYTVIYGGSHDLKKWDTETNGIYAIYKPSGLLVASLAVLRTLQPGGPRVSKLHRSLGLSV